MTTSTTPAPEDRPGSDAATAQRTVRPGARSALAARRRALGAYGEELAARHLCEEAGMVLLDRNWRCATGELDLVLRDGDVLVACEVKTRSSHDCGTPHEAVDERKVARVRRLAVQWARAHLGRPVDIRIDMVAVLRPRSGPVVLEHVRGLG